MIGIQIDPNGPWHHDNPSNVTWLVTSVRDPGFGEVLSEGHVKVGDTITAYTGQGDGRYENDWAMTQLAVVREVLDVSKGGDPFWLIYLELA